ncbi:MAG: molybdate ABC transporter substrate-binding protein [Thermodesulfobacteriota bacterium]
MIMNLEFKKAAFIVLLSVLVFLPAVKDVGAVEPEEITVSAASSLKDAFTEISKQFEASHPAIKVRLNFGASGDLQSQIRGGAPVDVFASDAAKEMDELLAEGRIKWETKSVFASNGMVLIVPASSRVVVSSFEDLTKAKVKKIAVGNPRTVPAGRYADDVFHYLKIFDDLKNKLMPAENVSQALDYTARGEVDAGVVYATDAATRPADVKVVTTAPEGSHTPIDYPIAVVKGTRHEAPARLFVDFVVSEAGLKILADNGFRPLRDR